MIYINNAELEKMLCLLIMLVGPSHAIGNAFYGGMALLTPLAGKPYRRGRYQNNP